LRLRDVFVDLPSNMYLFQQKHQTDAGAEISSSYYTSIKPRKFNIAPEKWWLEDDPFLLGFR